MRKLAVATAGQCPREESNLRTRFRKIRAVNCVPQTAHSRDMACDRPTLLYLSSMTRREGPTGCYGGEQLEAKLPVMARKSPRHTIRGPRGAERGRDR